MLTRKIWHSRRRTSFAGLGGGFPVSGGTSQSLVNEEGGARTPLSTALAAVFILVVVLFFSHLLKRLAATGPRGRGLGRDSGSAQTFNFESNSGGAIDPSLWWRWRLSSACSRSASSDGVMIGAAISLVQLVRVSSRPHVALLGRIPGTRRFSDRDRHAGQRTDLRT